MTFAFVMRKPGRAGAGVEFFGAQAVAIAMTATDAAISLRCMDVARYVVNGYFDPNKFCGPLPVDGSRGRHFPRATV